MDLYSCSTKTFPRSGFVKYHNIVLWDRNIMTKLVSIPSRYYTISGPAFRFKPVAYEQLQTGSFIDSVLPSTQVGTFGSYLWMLQFKETKIEPPHPDTLPVVPCVFSEAPSMKHL